jgi:hypothetical protein
MQLFSCLTWPCMLTFNWFCTLLSISHTSVGPTQPTPSNIDTFVHPYWTCVLANYPYTVSELLVECSLIDGLGTLTIQGSFRLADKMMQMHCIRPCSETSGLGWNFLGVTLGPLGVQCIECAHFWLWLSPRSTVVSCKLSCCFSNAFLTLGHQSACHVWHSILIS